MGLTIAQSRLAYFHLEYLVLSPDPFSSPLQVCVGEEGNAILASSAQGGYVTSPRHQERASPTYVLSVGCGKTRKAGSPVLGLDSTLQAGEKGKEGAFQILLGNFQAVWTSFPRTPNMSEPLSPHSALDLLPPHSRTLPDLTIPSSSNYTLLPAQASAKQ